MSLRVLIGPIGLALAAATLAPPLGAGADTAERAAPDRGAKSTWTEADKAGFGTARDAAAATSGSPSSRAGSARSSTPTCRRPASRNLELVVTDGRTFTDRESTDMRHRVATRPDARSLRFTQVNTATSGRYRITKTYRDRPGPRRAVRAGPPDVARRAAATGSSRCTTRRSPTTGWTTAPAPPARRWSPTTAERRHRPACRARAFDADLERLLRRERRLDRPEGRPPPRQATPHAGPGNVVQTGRVARRDRTRRPPARHADPRLRPDGRRPRSARHATPRRLRSGARRRGATTAAGTATSARSRRCPPAPRASGASTSPRHWSWPPPRTSCTPGAFVASPSAPWVWGDEVDGLSSPVRRLPPGLVARRLPVRHRAVGAWATRRPRRRIVDWLFGVQQKPDGSFPQNSDVTGTAGLVRAPARRGRAADRAGAPGRPRRRRDVRRREEGRELPRRLRGRGHRASRRRTRRRSAGRTSPATRPNSIAAQISGLVCAADIARRNGDHASRRRWLALADEWQSKVKDWTVTTNGPLSEPARTSCG